jgi:tetratricopeptide (TPR) repeat protein
MRVFLTFLRLLVVPIHQNLDYDYPASTGLWGPPLTLVGLCVLLGLSALVFQVRRNFPLVAFGLAWVLITFSVNLAPRSNVIFEHKLYLISFGFILAVAAALSKAVANRRRLLMIFGCMAVVLGLISFERNKVWADELTLWKDSLKNSPQKARVNANLGRVYGTLGQLDQAVYYLSRAIAINPDNISYENRGVIYSLQGRYSRALEDLNISIKMDPGYFPTYVKRSWVLQKQGQYNAALMDLDHAIQAGPYFTDAYIERGMLLAQIGQLRQAAMDFQKVLDIDPYNQQAASARSYCLAKISGP